MSSQSLTKRLLSHPSTRGLYEPATQAPFLRSAGEGKLPLKILSEWLSQDRLYAQAYLRFIGGLISKVELPSRLDHAGAESTSTIEWRILQLLSSALQGIMTEIKFFETTASKYGIDLQSSSTGQGTGSVFGPNEVTSKYIALFDSFHDTATESKVTEHRSQITKSAPRSLLEGLVVLWATEKVYHDAWAYARSHTTAETRNHSKDLDGGALNEDFIPNWTSKGFVAFVEEIETCLDTFATMIEDGEETGLRIWQQVLDLERDFWPKMDS